MTAHVPARARRPRTLDPLRSALRVSLLTPLVALGLCAGAAAAQESPGEPVRYARALEGGLPLFNLEDRKGVEVGRLPAGELVAVHGERVGWLEVEPAAGVEVWVYGSFVRASDVPGWLEITGDNVNMRPLPSRDAGQSFPLPQRLYRGDRVRLIERHDPSRNLDEDWIRVRAPAGTHVYAPADATEAVPASAAARSEWRSASLRSARDLESLPKVAGTPAADEAAKPVEPTPAQASEASQALARAEELLTAQRGAADPDIAALRAAYEEVVALAPQSLQAQTARTRLREVDVLAEIERMEAELATAEAERQARLRAAEQRVDEASARKDPLWGRFNGRGWLESERRPGLEEPVYVLRWAGDAVAEVVCTSGRYDLSLFDGFELGVVGSTFARGSGSVSGARTDALRPARTLDASRIEVLAGRMGL